MYRSAFFNILFLFGVTYLFSQSINPFDLENTISSLNDREEYEESIQILEEIIIDPASTHVDKAHANIQKSFTYKRLLNYSVALKKLDLAEQEALMAQDSQDRLISKIWAERLFVYFDWQNHAEVDKIIKKFDDKRIDQLERETKAFFYSIKGTLAQRKGEFSVAEQNYDKAIAILEKEYPKHLPNLYRTKMTLYGAMGKHDKVLEAYNLGMEDAKKYNVALYQYALDEELQKYYGSKGDFENAYKSFLDLRRKGTEYNFQNRSGDLMALETALLEQQKAAEIAKKQRQQYFLFALLGAAAIIIVITILILRITRQKKKLIEKENAFIRSEVERLSEQLISSSSSRSTIDDFDLTERQRQIIELVQKGQTNKEIGDELFISENTVKYHLKSIYEILGVQNRTDLKHQYE